MLSINMDDVMQVVSNIQNYLIAFGVVLVLALLVMFAVRKMPKAKKKMIRAQSGLAILLALAIVVNLICIGPMSTMLDLVSGEGSISEETSAEATELVNEITQEGIVLAQNDDNILPCGFRLQAERLRLGFHQPLLWRHRFRRSERRLPCHRPAHRSA